MKRSAIAALGWVTLGLVPGGAAAQEFVLPATDAVASAEAFGASHPRSAAADNLDVPSWWDAEPEGSRDRVCVDVTRDMGVVRSGEIVIGGFLFRLQAGRQTKLWWKPLDSSLDMTLELVSRSLDGVEGQVAFDIGPVTSTYTNDRPPQPIPEEAFFPGGVEFPAPGRWITVATSGDNWGCFVFEVPAEPPPPLGG